MKSGLIIYVVGKEPANWDADSELMTIKQNTKADLVEIITAQTGHFDVIDAGNLTLTSRQLRLCG